MEIWKWNEYDERSKMKINAFLDRFYFCRKLKDTRRSHETSGANSFVERTQKPKTQEDSELENAVGIWYTTFLN